MKNQSLITELFNKAFKQESDINDEISKILKGTYPLDTIDKIKQKISEKIENFDNTINLLTDSHKDVLDNYNRDIWLKKKSNLILTKRSMQKRVDDAVNKTKMKNSNCNIFPINNNQTQYNNNLNNLRKEREVLNHITLIANEIENNGIVMSNELTNQSFSLTGIKDKITGMYGLLTTSDLYTKFMIKRGQGDTMLCLFLGFLTIVIIYYCYYYIRPKIKGIE